ncbi:MAG: hypothetical protein ACK5AL_09960 [Planctomycetota bacterium]
MPGQVLLADDFQSGAIDPAKWSVVTSGIPQGGASVSVQGGRCALQNRGHLVSQQPFDVAANGPYRVRCTWQWTDAYDTFVLAIRSNGVPTPPWGGTEHAVFLAAGMEGGSSAGIRIAGGLVALGAESIAGPGVQFAVGIVYTAELVDLGWGIRARIEGPGGQWWEFERAVTASTSPHRRLVVHNREATMGTHLCWLDDVVVEAMPAASITPFGQGCLGPYGQTPTLAAAPGSLPRLGQPCTFVVGALPGGLVAVPVFVFGFDNAMNHGSGGSYPLPFDLGLFGWPGCQQLVSLDLTAFAITTTGSAQHTLQVPFQPPLAGWSIHAQALVLYHAGGVAVSNAVTATVGW